MARHANDNTDPRAAELETPPPLTMITPDPHMVRMCLEVDDYDYDDETVSRICAAAEVGAIVWTKEQIISVQNGNEFTIRPKDRR